MSFQSDTGDGISGARPDASQTESLDDQDSQQIGADFFHYNAPLNDEKFSARSP